MKVGNRQFTPRMWAVALYVALLCLMLWLGNWQMDRAALKVAMAEAAEAARQAPPVALQTLNDPAIAARTYTRVIVQGRYDEQHQFLWDNRTHEGVAGYEVLTPLQLENGEWVLVNRGWVPMGLSRENKPAVALPPDVVSQTVTLQGWLSQPSRGLAGGPALAVDHEAWPKRVQYLDYDAMATALGAPLLPGLVQVQALDEDARQRTVLTDRPEWLTANWQPAASGPAKHYSYAFQWFAMALALTVIFIIVNLRRIDGPDHQEE